MPPHCKALFVMLDALTKEQTQINYEKTSFDHWTC